MFDIYTKVIPALIGGFLMAMLIALIFAILVILFLSEIGFLFNSEMKDANLLQQI